MRHIDSESLRHRLNGRDEIALLDVREQGAFGQCHLFHAISTPLSRLELQVPRLLPRRSVPVVVSAGGDATLGESGVEALARLGYDDIALCPDAPEAWGEAGFTLYSGINVPSKAFGEAVEHFFATPSVDAASLKAMQDNGDDLVVLDSRTEAEYRNMNIPQGVSVPGGELAYRVRDLAPAPDTTVIVNCAGRTRSIIGAQSVINSGIPNRVLALENGTMGWHLAGLELEHGSERRYPAGDPASITAAREMRDRIVADYGLSVIDRQTLGAWQSETDQRTLYLLDVRAPDEYAAGHLRGARSAPGGQLVQATDFHIGVPKGRVVLVDDTGVRAAMTAHWLVQMGLPDVHVLEGGFDGLPAGTGAEPSPVPAGIDGISPTELAARLDREDVFVLDVGESRVFRKAHVPGAAWAIRSHIAATGPDLPKTGEIVLTSEDGRLAGLAVSEVAGLSGARVRVLEGGSEAWISRGHPVETTPAYPADEACLDVYLRAYDRNADVEAKMQEYIDWEIALVDQIAADPDVAFRLGPVT